MGNDYKDDEDPTKYKSVKTGRGPLIENCEPDNDGIQTRDHSIQVVGTPRSCRKLHSFYREEALLEFSQTGVLLDRQVARDDNGGHQGAGGKDQA